MQRVERKSLLTAGILDSLKSGSQSGNTASKRSANGSILSKIELQSQQCGKCDNGLVDPPEIDFTTIPTGMTTREVRTAQFADGELQFCECSAGDRWRKFFQLPMPDSQADILRRNATEATQRRRQSLWDNAGVPAKYKDLTLKSFVALAGKDPEKQQAIYAVRKFYEEGGLLEEGLIKVGIFLHGDPGVGKTGILSPLFVDMLKQGYSGLWVQYNELMASLRDFESGNVQERIEMCQSVDYLFIDDFGDPGSFRGATDYARDTMFRIIDYRNNNTLPMFVTSNLDMTQIGDQFHVRLARRLGQSCAVIKMGGRAL